MNWETVIGIEVHVELNTKTKMFCRCSADYFGAKPNSHTCPVCLGLPGSLPIINEEAIKKCIQIGLALGCTISSKSLFERKNYFYPDLPKGYQISQYRWPLCVGGKLVLDSGKTIRVNRAHQEEDTGKLTHLGSETLIDFNRSSVPLVEVVTEPDFSSSEEVREYAQKLQQIFRYLGVSNADMERGDMRLEANVSVRLPGQKELPNYRVELKNINSFRFMVAAIEYEIKRQIAALEKGEKLSQETRGWNADKKCTYLQRSKEEAHDYRYFPEPDIPEISYQSSDISLQTIKDQMPELPWDKQKRFVSEFKLIQSQAKILTESKELAAYFEMAIKHGKEHGVEAVSIANYLINTKINIEEILIAQLIDNIKGKKAGIIGDEGELEKLAQQAIDENPKVVQDYKQSLPPPIGEGKKGKASAINVLIGAVMRISGGKADVSLVKPIL